MCIITKLDRENFGIILKKNKMATMSISLSVMKQFAGIFPLPPLGQKVLKTEFLNLQDMFIITSKACLGQFLAI